jgi:hypothetical protein
MLYDSRVCEILSLHTNHNPRTQVLVYCSAWKDEFSVHVSYESECLAALL